MPWPWTGAIDYPAQSGLLDKVCAIKALVVCNSWEREFHGTHIFNKSKHSRTKNVQRKLVIIEYTYY